VNGDDSKPTAFAPIARGASVRPGPAGLSIADYESARATFRWDDTLLGVDGARGVVNIADHAVTRHASSARRDHVALRHLVPGQEPTTITFGDLDDTSNRFAQVLRDVGIGAGDAVFLMLGRRPELYTCFYGALKVGAVVCPLFNAFGPEPVRQRVTSGDGRALVTTGAVYRRKIAQIREACPRLDHVFLVDAGDGSGSDPSTRLLADALAAVEPRAHMEPTGPETPALLHFTSGTTGAPKGVVHVHDAVRAHRWTASVALDLHPDDTFWCTADPGWVTGTSYGVIAPLVIGCTSVVDHAELEAERWYRTIEQEAVTVWYTSPTALRMLMRAADEPALRHDLGSLRLIASVGEPLNPEIVLWAQRVLGRPVLDNWWQTETGGIMIANLPCLDIRPGSMGRPIPGIDATILEIDPREPDRALERDGEPVVAAVDQPGHLALRAGWPSMFRTYKDQPERYDAAFVDGWYVSGDLARVDDAGYFWFVGRADDMIKSSGHLIGPFEVESALMEHPAVVEAGVIGTPDPVAGAIVKAFVTLADGYAPDDDMALDLIGFARTRLGPAVAPRRIEFDQHLPHTRSGKVLRRLLRQRELGLPEGDTSTLEDP
jgi:acetyl-CoA synthetase